MTLVIAHRGYKQVNPENTMAAFEAAAQSGAQMIETDIHVCKSGEIVIMHDDDVAATSNGTGHISEMTLAQLQQLDAGSWFGEAFQGQQIPTLKDLVSFYQKYPNLQLLLEFKGEWNKENCIKAIAELNDGNLRNRTVLESFDTQTMANLRDVAPEYDRGLLIEYPDPNYPVTNSPFIRPSVEESLLARLETTGGDLPTIPQLIDLCKELGVMCLNPSVAIVRDNPELVEECHRAGLQVMVWTADLPVEFQHLTSLRVDAICTNQPGFLTGWLAAK